MRNVELVIIGAGPAGLCAASKAYKSGINDILILERDSHPGGILQQCIHNGFGLHRFKEELTGPEYAYKCEQELVNIPIKIQCETTVTDITPDKVITAVSKSGTEQIKAKAIILAMGCRERPRGALNISGTRPSGIFSAGTAQKYVNMMGYMPGKNVVILGSGDIGLIMARRMTLEGAKVHAVCEVMPYSGGLERNIQQCLRDFNIPLMLSHTVTKIHGDDRITGVTISEVDKNMKPVAGTEQYIACDTLLLSVGLIPENELSKSAGIILDTVTKGAVVDQTRQTNVEGIYACGNVLHVHDLADFVSEEAEIAAENASYYIKSGFKKNADIKIVTDGKVRYTVPQKITDTTKNIKLFFRVSNIYKNIKIIVKDGENVIFEQKKEKVAPGEMQTIILKSDKLRQDANEIKICIDEDIK
ncbi:MAG: FAD-dependent oxidoreductase [Clostridia bacterium]|nr:FAD-dependent oxidoreductase [Clostridia bacterium]